MLQETDWNRLRDYVLDREHEALDSLGELIRIPTVAHPAVPNPAMNECAELLREWLVSLGSRDARIVTPEVNPLVLGSIGSDSSKPTVLVYGHFDVQDPGPEEDWNTPPFEPVIRDGRIFARGSGDNKGQFLAHLLAVQAYQALEIPLPVNLKFILDGGEEIGSGDFALFAADQPPELRADYAFTSDGPVHESGRPTMVLGGRGIAYLKIHLRTINRSTHSQYAPILPNAAWHLLEALQSMRSADGTVLVDGFYDDVLPPTDRDLELLRAIPSPVANMVKILEPTPFAEISGEDYYRRMLMEPVLNIAGFAAGDLTGNRTIVPGDATAKVEALLVPNQRSEKVIEQIRDHLKRYGIKDEDVEVMFSMEPSRTPPEHPMVAGLTRAIERAWNQSPVVMNRFASYAPYYLFDQLGIPGFYIAYAQPDQSNHAPNENLDLRYFMNGILTSIAVLDEFGAGEKSSGSVS